MQDDEDDFYSDLPKVGEVTSDFKDEQIKTLQQELEQVKNQLQETQLKLKEKEKENNQLRVNISKLYYTAKQEIEKLSGNSTNSSQQSYSSSKKRKK